MAESSTHPARYRLDDLRALATSLAIGVGVEPSRASALATHLLWFDAAGASSHGIARLPDWLERIDRKEIDPVTVGRAGLERAGTAVFDGLNGIPPLILDRAAGIASEKARDVGIGMVRVLNLARTGSVAPVAAALAIGPHVAILAGPGSTMTIALPGPEGLPVLFDSALGEGFASSTRPDLGIWNPWISAISGGEGWVVLALSVTAFESLPAFSHRVAEQFRRPGSVSGLVLPGEFESRRREAREAGVSIDEAATAVLKFRADRSGVPWPNVLGG